MYLWGAGATHAEGQRLGSRVSLLMRDTRDFGEGITSRILKRAGKRVVSAFGAGEGVDIEKLISLLASSGNDGHSTLAEKLRESYFAELKSSLAKAEIASPQLAIDLLTFHRRIQAETLSGFITTNHDGLLQIASNRVFGGLNVGFDFQSKDFVCAASKLPPVLQIHGSFTWHFGLPIRIDKLVRASTYANTVWIPPTTLKESKNYPFNKLFGLAYELLARRCDVLRIVGTSLTQNDWNVLSLIFNAQRHREATRGHAFLIELIMPQDRGDELKRDCAYLKNLQPIGHLTDGHFAVYKTGDISPESDMANPLAFWLNEKIEFHRLRGDLAANTNMDTDIVRGAAL